MGNTELSYCSVFFLFRHISCYSKVSSLVIHRRLRYDIVMDSKPSARTRTAQPVKLEKYAFFQILLVIFVGAMLATFFTAWTTPGMIPGHFGDNINVVTIPDATGQSAQAGANVANVPAIIGIVAGHTGNDSGAVCPDGLTEVSINQQVAAYVQQYLKENKINAEIFKEFDDHLSGFRGLALISIHTDSCEFVNDQATGFKVASSTSNPQRSVRLTSCMRTRYAQATGLPLHNSVTVDMTSYHVFDQIDTDTPALIIEVGFMNLDRQLLTKHADLVARGITNGILCFINNEDLSPTPIPTATTKP